MVRLKIRSLIMPFLIFSAIIWFRYLLLAHSRREPGVERCSFPFFILSFVRFQYIFFLLSSISRICSSSFFWSPPIHLFLQFIFSYLLKFIFFYLLYYSVLDPTHLFIVLPFSHSYFPIYHNILSLILLICLSFFLSLFIRLFQSIFLLNSSSASIFLTFFYSSLLKPVKCCSYRFLLYNDNTAKIPWCKTSRVLGQLIPFVRNRHNLNRKQWKKDM